MTGLRVRRVAAGIAICASAVSTIAVADVYSWTDDHGVLNFGNVDPPAGASATLVVREAPVRPAAAVDAARQAELRALSARLRQLEAEVGPGNAPPAYPPPPGVYPPVPGGYPPSAGTYPLAPYPTGAAYPTAAAEPAPIEYVPPPPSWSGVECDPVFSDCFGGLYAAYLPPVYTVYAPVPYRRHAGYRSYAGARAIGPHAGPVQFGAAGRGTRHTSRR